MKREKLTPKEWLEYYKNKLDKTHKTYRPSGFKIIENALNEKEEQDFIIKTIKEIIQFGRKLPDVVYDEDSGFSGIVGAIGMNIQRAVENKERELLRNWIFKECFPKELKVLKIIKEKGLNYNELLMIKEKTTWTEYIEIMQELYYGDEDMKRNLKTRGEWNILKRVFYDNRRKN